MLTRSRIGRFFTLILLLIISPLSWTIEIVIDQGVQDPILIAVVPFIWSQAENLPPLDIAEVIRFDLQRSGLFRLIAQKDLPQKPADIEQVNFSDWKLLGIENLLIGRLIKNNEGNYEVLFRLLDVYTTRQIAGFKISAHQASLRYAAHQVSDVIFEKLIGVKGDFTTRIAYVSEHEQTNEIYYTLQIADADGYNPQILLKSSEPLLSPAWSNDGQYLAYVSFENKNSEIYIQNIKTGERENIASFNGINSAPSWSPDDNKIAFTSSKDGNSEIYILDLETGSVEQLTDNLAIDTEPDWSHDGKRLVFTSDRGGSPQIYEIQLKDRSLKRLSFTGKYNARPVYSPNSQSIVMVHQDKTGYHIALLDRASDEINVLTNSTHDESPSFSPNGNMIIYTTKKHNRSVLASVSVDGQIHQHLSSQRGDVREPVWGPYR